MSFDPTSQKSRNETLSTFSKPLETAGDHPELRRFRPSDAHERRLLRPGGRPRLERLRKASAAGAPTSRVALPLAARTASAARQLSASLPRLEPQTCFATMAGCHYMDAFVWLLGSLPHRPQSWIPGKPLSPGAARQSIAMQHSNFSSPVTRTSSLCSGCCYPTMIGTHPTIRPTNKHGCLALEARALALWK